MIQLFEEFNEKTGKEFVEKLVLFSKPSPYVKSVTEVMKIGNSLEFSIHTNLPGENNPDAKKVFKIIVPLDFVSRAKVETYENEKRTFSTSLEPKGEDNEMTLVMNFVEATGIYDDPIIREIVDNFEKIKSSEDIQKIVDHT